MGRLPKHNRSALATATAVGGMALASICLSAGAALAEGSVTIASWGGAYQEAQDKALFQPGAAATGMEVKQETYGGMSDVRLKVQAGAVPWDIVSSGSGSAARAAEEGLLEPLDYNVIDVSTFYPGLYTPTCVGSDVFSTVLAYNTNTFSEDKAPKSWADFFNPEQFPGKRAYRDKVSGALEPAIMGDGVALADVYKVLDSEEGINRAIERIRALKPQIAVFWKSGAQHAQLMKDGEVDMTTGWNGRFDVAAKDGAKVAYTFNQALLDYDCFAIPKGAPNKDAAMKFLAAISTAEMQANLPLHITYGPTNKKAYEIGQIDDALARKMPSHPDNAALQVPISLEWYAKWEQKASQMYQDMLTE